MYKSFLFFLFASFLTFSAKAQQYPHADQSLPCLDKNFSIVVHIMRDSLGVTPHDSTSIKMAIEELNPLFAPICVTFSTCEIKFHDNFQYAKLDGSGDPKWEEMQVKYHEDNRINMYFVADLGGDEGGFASLAGVSMMTEGGIVIMELGTIPHEMGHFFGLLHTFEGNGIELVDGSNCTTAGDLICDTPADPFVAGDDLGEYLDDCLFISPKKDANGAFYVPDVGNVMSYYKCPCRGFTWGQFGAMANIYLGSSPRMW